MTITAKQAAKLLEGTTPGPWTVETGNVPIADTGDYDGYCRLMAGRRILFEQWGDDEQSEKDANLAGAAPDLARALFNARAELAQARADTDAAVALVVEQCAAEVRGSNLGLDINDIADDVRALAPADGLAAVDALRKERDRLAAELAAAKQRLENGLKWCDLMDGPVSKSQFVNGQATAAQQIRAALASTPPDDTWHERRTMLPDGDARAVKARGLRVKALEWSGYLPIPPTGEYHARSSVGLYCISHGVGCSALTLRDSTHLGVFPTLEAAKAAAQADYESRILAALEVTP